MSLTSEVVHKTTFVWKFMACNASWKKWLYKHSIDRASWWSFHLVGFTDQIMISAHAMLIYRAYWWDTQNEIHFCHYLFSGRSFCVSDKIHDGKTSGINFICSNEIFFQSFHQLHNSQPKDILSFMSQQQIFSDCCGNPFCWPYHCGKL